MKNFLYRRYDIEPKEAPDIQTMPSRFRVNVKRNKLAGLLLKEIIQYRGNTEVVMSRPCMYGVFSGPVGGFAPREELCVGCLRCTTEHPDIVQIYPNDKHMSLGDSFLTSGSFANLCYEAKTGRVPVRGAGYRGRFGGDGWDGMWTDMSEIVRPTRDGIHGREYISTSVDIGARPAHLLLAEDGSLLSKPHPFFSLPLPMLFDVPPQSVLQSSKLVEALVKAAEAIGTLSILPAQIVEQLAVRSRHVVPLFTDNDIDLLTDAEPVPVMVEFAGANRRSIEKLQARFPESVLCLRLDFIGDQELVRLVGSGQHVLHLVANYHGRSRDGRFVLNLIRDAHSALVRAGCREQATLLGSGGIVAAEHVPKALICGLDAAALDTALLAAVQARFRGECSLWQTADFELPGKLSVSWARQRIVNLMASWHDQMLEILGAMGIREVRRLRGEMGRAMFQKDLEREAFLGIEGYGD